MPHEPRKQSRARQQVRAAAVGPVPPRPRQERRNHLHHPGKKTASEGGGYAARRLFPVGIPVDPAQPPGGNNNINRNTAAVVEQYV